MRIHRVEGKGDLREFLRVPDGIYGKDPLWVPPLRSDQRSQFDPARNPFLLHCERRLFLLKEGGRAIGRIAAFEDTIASESWGERVGLFGYFECPDDASAATELLNAARDWLRGLGCTAMQGPWSFVSQEWGLVVEGFEPEPVVMAPYNPPYYAGLLEGYGLRKVKDLLCWEVSVADVYRIPDRIMKLTDRVAERYGVRVRRIDMRRYDRGGIPRHPPGQLHADRRLWLFAGHRSGSPRDGARSQACCPAGVRSLRRRLQKVSGPGRSALYLSPLHL
jgi:hypothetical protein